MCPSQTMVDHCGTSIRPSIERQISIERPPMLSSRSFSLNSAIQRSATCCLSRLAVRAGRSTWGLRRVRSEASPCRHHVSRPRNPFVKLLIGRNESIPQQMSSDVHKGSALDAFQFMILSLARVCIERSSPWRDRSSRWILVAKNVCNCISGLIGGTMLLNQ
jgi:hypothetical protein